MLDLSFEFGNDVVLVGQLGFEDPLAFFEGLHDGAEFLVGVEELLLQLLLLLLQSDFVALKGLVKLEQHANFAVGFLDLVGEITMALEFEHEVVKLLDLVQELLNFGVAELFLLFALLHVVQVFAFEGNVGSRKPLDLGGDEDKIFHERDAIDGSVLLDDFGEGSFEFLVRFFEFDIFL